MNGIIVNVVSRECNTICYALRCLRGSGPLHCCHHEPRFHRAEPPAGRGHVSVRECRGVCVRFTCITCDHLTDRRG